MSRFVKPLTQEEWDKLPKWQQWLDTYSVLLVGIFFLFIVALIIAL